MKIPGKISLVVSPAEKCYKYIDCETNEVTTYPCDIEKMDVKFFEKLESGLKELFEKTFLGKVNGFNLILPDDFYGITSISVPKLNKTLSMNNIKTELQARFQNFNELNFEYFMISQNLDKNLFLIRYVKKEVISQCHKIFGNLKKVLLSVTPRFLASIKNVEMMEPRLKQRNFVVFDIQEQVTYVTICEKTNVISYHQLDFGRKILSTTTIAKEENLFNHKPAQLAVIKAKAAAKAKKGIPDTIETPAEEEEELVDESVDGFEVIMKNWDNFMKQVNGIMDNDFFYRNFIKFDDVLFILPKDLHYVVSNSTLEDEFDESGMEVKKKQKVVNTLERKQPYARKPQLRKREFATFTKQTKKEIQLRSFDVSDLALSKKNLA